MMIDYKTNKGVNDYFNCLMEVGNPVNFTDKTVIKEKDQLTLKEQTKKKEIVIIKEKDQNKNDFIKDDESPFYHDDTNEQLGLFPGVGSYY